VPSNSTGWLSSGKSGFAPLVEACFGVKPKPLARCDAGSHLRAAVEHGSDGRLGATGLHPHAGGVIGRDARGVGVAADSRMLVRGRETLAATKLVMD
jgi:hypothetical protein